MKNKKLNESYQVTGTAYLTDWFDQEGTIEMKPYYIDEITPEAICQGANDNGFGVKEITGIEAFVDGEWYEFYGDEFRKYSQGKEQKGIQVPKVELGNIDKVNYYCIYTDKENYPVIEVNGKYLITRNGTNDFSGQWELKGFIPFRYSLDSLIDPKRALNIKDWLFKNRTSRYSVVDIDHGSQRTWSRNHSLQAFEQIREDTFKILIGNKDSIIIGGKEYPIGSSLKESKKDPIGIYTLTNTSGIIVYDFNYGIEDEALVGSDFGKTMWVPIEYDEDGRPYFKYYKYEVYLDEVLRTNL